MRCRAGWRTPLPPMPCPPTPSSAPSTTRTARLASDYPRQPQLRRPLPRAALAAAEERRTVRDHGAGMAPDDLPRDLLRGDGRLFERVPEAAGPLRGMAAHRGD